MILTNYPRILLRPKGFSLIELMIAITLGLLLLAAVSVLMSQQSTQRTEIDRAGRQIENGRYAISILQDDIQLAGFYGYSGVSVDPLAAVPDPCELGNSGASLTAIRAALSAPIQVYNSPASVPAPLSGCLNSANVVANTDILVIRRVQADEFQALEAVNPSSPVTSPTRAASVEGRVYVQAIPNSRVVDVGGTGAAARFTLTQKDPMATRVTNPADPPRPMVPADIRRLVVRIYFVSPCNVPASGTVCTAAADNGTPIPTLKRMELSESAAGPSSPGFTTTALVEGVENVQYDLGIDNVFPLDGAPDGDYVVTPATTADIANIVSVRVNLLARDTEATPGITDAKTYQLGLSTVGPLGGAFKRHAYSVVVRAINSSGTRQ